MTVAPAEARPPEARDVAFRSLDADDAPRLRAVFDGLSEQSRYFRYLGPKRVLSESELRFFTDVDHHDHEAILACAGNVPVGVARYVRQRGDPRSADVAVEVVDEWQRHGIGSALLRRIAGRARDEGVESLHATLLSSNRAILATIGNLDAPWRTTSREGPVLGIDIALAEP